MTEIHVLEKPPPVPSGDQKEALRATAGYARDAGELEMFADQLGIRIPERENKITEGEDR